MTSKEAAAILRAAADRRLCVHVNGRPHEMEPDEIDTAQRMAIEALERDRWISVEERLPPLFDETYLVCLAWGGVGTMVFKATGFHNYGSFSPVPIETVTYWMPLPEPPKEET